MKNIIMYPNSLFLSIIYTFTSGIWNKKILIQKNKFGKRREPLPWEYPGNRVAAMQICAPLPMKKFKEFKIKKITFYSY